MIRTRLLLLLTIAGIVAALPPTADALRPTQLPREIQINDGCNISLHPFDPTQPVTFEGDGCPMRVPP